MAMTGAIMIAAFASAQQPPVSIPDPPMDAEGIAALPKMHFRAGATPPPCERSIPSRHSVAKLEPLILGLYVGVDGQVKATRVLHSSGVRDFDRAAEDCLRHARDIEPSGVQPGSEGSWQYMSWNITLR
jgi:hypothetical protein